jgi:hypothetical protein
MSIFNLKIYLNLNIFQILNFGKLFLNRKIKRENRKKKHIKQKRKKGNIKAKEKRERSLKKNT